MKIIFSALLISIVGAYAQNCQMPGQNEWSAKVLTSDITGSVAFGLTPKGDVFLAEMNTGHIKLFSSANGTTTDLGKVNDSVYSDIGGTIENGLLGVTPDPNYATNNWIYAFYSKKISDKTTTDCRRAYIAEHKHILVRFTVANGKLTNAKTILSFHRWSTSHAAGALVFSKQGDLYISTGDDTNPTTDDNNNPEGNQNAGYGPRGAQGACQNRPLADLTGTDAQATAGNTNDLRGKILRIKPIPFLDTNSPVEGVGTTYTIPDGNLFDKSKDVGNKTRPEIYTMGHRNPYRFRIDPVTGWVLIGEVGPDARIDRDVEQRGNDEINLVTRPGNFGWPYANADNRPYRVKSLGEGNYVVGDLFDLVHMKNKSPRNTGLEDLPPAIPALAWYNSGATEFGALNKKFGGGNSTAIGGPRYWYSATGPNSRLPAYFQGKFITGDWTGHKMWVLDVDQNGTLRNVEDFSAPYSQSSIIDMDIGPDGTLYELFTGGYGQWDGQSFLVKVEYTGPQYAASVCGDKIVTVGLQSKQLRHSDLNQKAFSISGNESSLNLPQGVNEINLYNTQGKVVWHSKVIDNVSTFAIPSQFQNKGLLFVKFGF